MHDGRYPNNKLNDEEYEFVKREYNRVPRLMKIKEIAEKVGLGRHQVRRIGKGITMHGLRYSYVQEEQKTKKEDEWDKKDAQKRCC